MTPEQLEQFRMNAQIQALRVLVESLFVTLANSTPTAAQALRDRFSELRQSHSNVVLKNTDSAYSDMLSGEYQSALEDLLSSIERQLRP